MKLSAFLTLVITCCLLQPAEAQVNNNVDTVFTQVEQPAQYPGGFEAMAEYLKKNMAYPKDARRSGIQGTVFVSFIVNKDGSISDVAVIKGIGGDCDQEAMRVVSIFPTWTPGMHHGKIARSRFVLPLDFKLGR